MGFFSKLFGKKNDEDIFVDPKDAVAKKVLSSEIVSISDSTYLVSMAARMCVGMKPVDDYAKRLEHIRRVNSRGHESVMEHTNIITILHFSKEYLHDFMMLAQSFEYLKYKTIYKDGIYHALIGGSIRGYKHVVRITRETNFNRVYSEFRNLIKYSIEKVFFEDLIADNGIEPDGFIEVLNRYDDVVNTEPDAEGNYEADSTYVPHENIVTDVADIVDGVHTKFYDILNNVRPYGFSESDLMDFVTLSVIFHDISRPISMQINRHRNAISQESQRYVNYSKKGFIDPLKYLKDKDKQNHKFEIELFDTKKKIKSNDLGIELCKIYEQLFKQNMFKQDARAFLPSNVCTKELVTFTYRNLFHFFKMRLAKDAQPEIQYVANKLYDAFAIYDSELIKEHSLEELINMAESPVYKIEKQKKLEEDLKIEEVLESEDI